MTPDHVRGRVSAVSNLFIGASAELGDFETGVVARLLGPVGAAIFGGIGSLAVTGAWAKMFPDLRKADRLDGTEIYDTVSDQSSVEEAMLLHAPCNHAASENQAAGRAAR